MANKIAITGATGFIGGELVRRHIEEGDDVRVMSRRSSTVSNISDSVQWFQGDLSESKNLLAFVEGVDVLYHCAGEVRDKSLMESVHIHGTHRLIDSATGRIGRWVQLSSTGAYGRRCGGIISEETKLNPFGTYEVTKVKSDALVIAASLNGAFEHVILRPSNVYGSKMRNQSLYSLISMIKRGLFFFIGKPGASANYIHVNNVVEALLLCGSSSHAKGQIYNLSDNCSLEYFVGNIAELLDCGNPRKRLPEATIRVLAALFDSIPAFPLTRSRIDALTNRSIYSIDKISDDLGYRHLTSMRAGLADLVSYWHRTYIDNTIAHI